MEREKSEGEADKRRKLCMRGGKKKKHQHSMEAWDGGQDEDLALGCVPDRYAQKEEMYAFVWILYVWAYFCVFVFVCLQVLFSCVRASVDAPSKSRPRRGVFHDFITQALYKALSNTPPFLSAPLWFFPMLPLFFHIFPIAFFTLCSPCPLHFFTIPYNALPRFLPSLSCGFTPLLPLSPPSVLWFHLHSPAFSSCSRLLFTSCC